MQPRSVTIRSRALARSTRDVAALALLVLATSCATTRDEIAQAPQQSAAVENAPQDIAALKQEAGRAFQASDWPTTAALYEEIVAREPSNGGAWFRRGYALHAMQDYRASAKAFERSNELAPHPITAYDAACAKARLGQHDAALDWLEKSVTLGMKDVATLSTDADLETLRVLPRYQEIVQRLSAAANPCEARAESHQLDFWVGEWDVFDLAGNKAGDSKVERILGGCVLLENWSGRRGGHGKSFNVYDTTDKCWKQTWCDDQGSFIEFKDGKLTDRALVFVANTPAANGQPALTRLTFFDQGENQVRQLFEQSTDGGGTWATQIDFVYKRKPAKA